MPPPVTTIERLRTIRGRVRQSHSLIASELLQALIDDLEREPELGPEPTPVHRATGTTRRPAQRRNGHGKPTCRYAWRQTKRGLVENRRHLCVAACTWTPEEDLRWLAVTPLPGSGRLMVRRGMDWCLCRLPMNAHYETVCDANGGIRGLRETKCEYAGRETRVPRL